MWANIIFYKLENLKPRKKEKILRTLWGKEQQSYYGRYKHRVGGMVDKVSHIKPTRSTLILGLKDTKEIIDFFKKNGVEYVKYKISVPKKHLEPRLIY